MPEETQITLPITGMTCANCVATVERSIKKVEGVNQAVVNLSSERATVEFNPDQGPSARGKIWTIYYCPEKPCGIKMFVVNSSPPIIPG